jgi:hypothetical protein
MQTNVWMRATVVYPLYLSLAGFLAGVLAYLLVPRARRPSKRLFLLPLPILIGLVSWFYLAPAVRFANALFWILPVSFMVIVTEIVGSTTKIRYGIIVAMVAVTNASIVWLAFQKPQVLQGFSSSGYAPIPEAALAKKATVSGLEVWTPTDGDQCWDAELPCTPYFDAELEFTRADWLPEFRLSGSGR